MNQENVNKLVDWIKANRNYPAEQLRQSALQGGSSEEDFNAALRIADAPVMTVPPTSSTSINIEPPQPLYASFIRRVIGFLVDGLIVNILVQIIFFIISAIFAVQFYDFILKQINAIFSITKDFPSAGFMVSVIKSLTIYIVSIVVINGLIYLIYKSITESSRMQASLGKMLVGLKVTDYAGGRLTFMRALGRNAASFLSSIIFSIGYLFPLFTKRKQTLHDLIASTVVIDEKHYGAGRMWLIFLGIILVKFLLSFLIPNKLNDIKSNIKKDQQRIVQETSEAERKYGLVDANTRIEIKNALPGIKEALSGDSTNVRNYFKNIPADIEVDKMSTQEITMLANTYLTVIQILEQNFKLEDDFGASRVKMIWLDANKNFVRVSSGASFIDLRKLSNGWWAPTN